MVTSDSPVPTPWRLYTQSKGLVTTDTVVIQASSEMYDAVHNTNQNDLALSSWHHFTIGFYQDVEPIGAWVVAMTAAFTPIFPDHPTGFTITGVNTEGMFVDEASKQEWIAAFITGFDSYYQRFPVVPAVP